MKKKYPRLPNGFGSIRNLGKGRRHPFAVHPPATEQDSKGNYIHKKPICYVDSWYVGFAVLNAYRAGTYKPGDEFDFAQKQTADASQYDDIIKRILSDYSQQKSFVVVNNSPTLKNVYEELYSRKFGENAPRKLSAQTKASFKTAFKHFQVLESVPIQSVTLPDLQRCFDDCKQSSATIEQMKNVISQIYSYGISRDYIEKDLSKRIIIPERKADEHGEPFSPEEIHTLLTLKNTSKTARLLLVMILSGFRISAYKTLKIDLTAGYFQGGVKTATSKDRIVPIHSEIMPLVREIVAETGSIIPNITKARQDIKEFCQAHNMNHTPHDTRHTFSALCEKYGVKESDRKRMLGHSFGNDITNGIYGHRTLDDLRTEIEKIKL